MKTYIHPHILGPYSMVLTHVFLCGLHFPYNVGPGAHSQAWRESPSTLVYIFCSGESSWFEDWLFQISLFYFELSFYFLMLGSVGVCPNGSVLYSLVEACQTRWLDWSVLWRGHIFLLSTSLSSWIMILWRISWCLIIVILSISVEWYENSSKVYLGATCSLKNCVMLWDPFSGCYKLGIRA